MNLTEEDLAAFRKWIETIVPVKDGHLARMAWEAALEYERSKKPAG
jgi:hypothetical protein